MKTYKIRYWLNGNINAVILKTDEPRYVFEMYIAHDDIIDIVEVGANV